MLAMRYLFFSWAHHGAKKISLLVVKHLLYIAELWEHLVVKGKIIQILQSSHSYFFLCCLSHLALESYTFSTEPGFWEKRNLKNNTTCFARLLTLSSKIVPAHDKKRSATRLKLSSIWIWKDLQKISKSIHAPTLETPTKAIFKISWAVSFAMFWKPEWPRLSCTLLGGLGDWGGGNG